MDSSPLRAGSAWSMGQIASYLQQTVIPLRLGCIDDNGFPLVCSLWYLFQDGHLWCATHEAAKVSRLLADNPKCAFEVAPNEPPYKGVRGQGTALLIREQAAEVLPKLIERYLGDSNSALSAWLLSRLDHEFAVRVDIDRITSWDYSERMSG